ncbi:erv1/alr family domain-containing protein [Rhizoctonia solani]|uniref:Sulfhydryl oxidase n=1 Tax=Rhizoctonia solani TaxID=456999 RepID=A0A8H8SUJ3_9AGAM|nr:erv1/alr family domain-containing protein [Rhizoctonia solani]QRW17158.1 erv1/alr family domain-containing protein [Rhizoctonia solani]
MPVPLTDESKPLPPGIVLGPDGKPCKVCSSFKAWSKSQRSGSSSNAAAKGTAATAAVAASSTTTSRENCPADVEALGRATWTFLHTTAAYYPTSPSAQHQSSMLALLRSLPSLYPCSHCASDFGKDIKKNPPEGVVGRNGGVITELGTPGDVRGTLLIHWR